MEHPIGNLMDTTMNKIKEMVDVNTIVGEPITAPDGTLIIPVSKVTSGIIPTMPSAVLPLLSTETSLTSP